MNSFNHVTIIRHRGEAVLRKHLRTFEENQISNIIRKTKGFQMNSFNHVTIIRHRGEAVLRKHLRTFEENQISNIIRKTKGKRRLKFHQFYSAKKYPKGYA